MQIKRDDPREFPWPVAQMETLGYCPICLSAQRGLLYSDLSDRIFFCAAGKWQLWTCNDCRSAYIDPRPDRNSIQNAYSNYYTHQDIEPRQDYGQLSVWRRLRRILANGYTNWRFGTNRVPSSILGVALHFLPGTRVQLEHQYRHLPRIGNRGKAVLDVGCGSGGFLLTAKACGWMVTGVDPDPGAVSRAKLLDVDVREGGLEVFDEQVEVFDAITLSHVIEHVHAPLEELRKIYRLLKPSGFLWLATPNIESFGHSYFGRHWRGLEPPRHLAIFSPTALRDALLAVGFTSVRQIDAPCVLKGIANASLSLRQDLSIGDAVEVRFGLRLLLPIVSLLERILPRRREFLVMVARKPD